jgi:hypothetical protein
VNGRASIENKKTPTSRDDFEIEQLLRKQKLWGIVVPRGGQCQPAWRESWIERNGAVFISQGKKPPWKKTLFSTLAAINGGSFFQCTALF